MQDLYYIGIKESDLEGCDNLYQGSLTILGSGKNGNIVIENTICYNSKELINRINNKFLMREWLKNDVPILKYQYKSGIEISTDHKPLVVQGKNSNGGSHTFLLNKENLKQIKENINPNDIYSVSEYCENNIPVNINCVISKNDIVLFPASVQIIKADKNFIYRGADFIACKKIEQDIKNKVKKYSLAICEQLQKIGYLGILGIDYIIYNHEAYFMEINPRFQSSTNLLNMALKENNQTTVNELCLKAFQNQAIDTKEIDVNYSKYIFEENDLIHELNVPYLKKQKDGFDEKQSIKEGAYKYSCIYDQSICQIMGINL